MDCDFCAYNEISIQVQQGKQHRDDFECGLCDFEADSLETLNLHLTTYESYQCYRCNVKIHPIRDIKKHIEEKHGSEYVSITHGKLDRKDVNFVKETIYEKDELIN